MDTVIDSLIAEMGDTFRGLWKGCVMYDAIGTEVHEEWTVTFIKDGNYYETPSQPTAEDALANALGKLNK